MRAALLDSPGAALRIAEVPDPVPGEGQVLLEVRACGVCRTDLHLADGELAPGHLPLILGHQIVGVRAESGERIGVPWLAWSCGSCRYCAGGRENLCERALFTGRDLDGGFAELAVAYEAFCLPLPGDLDDVTAAPLLCGGMIGYRALRLAGDAERLGLYGFGSAAHMICQLAVHEGRTVFAFTRSGDRDGQDFARSLGATWAGDAGSSPPEPLDAALIFAPAGELVPAALRAVGRGGVVVCAGIHMSDIPSFPYRDLWDERVLRSVANLTRADGEAFLTAAAGAGLRPRTTAYRLGEAAAALEDLRAGRVAGSCVLIPE